MNNAGEVQENYGKKTYVIINTSLPAEESFEAILPGRELPNYVRRNQADINNGAIVINELNPLSLRHIAQILIEDEKCKLKNRK